MGVSRRNFIKATAASAAVGAAGLSPSALFAGEKTVKIGMNIPMTGDYAPWGLPGLYGCEVVAKAINAKGGINVDGENYKIEMVAYDHAYDIEKAIQGYKKLTLEDDVKAVMMLGGGTVASIMPAALRKDMLVTTLLPSDITPDTKNLLAVCESHPLYNVTGVEWLAKTYPDAKTAAIVTNNDVEYGLQSAATYSAAFEVNGIDVIETNLHGFDITDFAPLVSSVLAKKPDIFCMATSFYVTPIMEQLYHQGFKGKIISCTLDYYDEIIAKTSKEFVDGTIFQFPDFDDPALEENTDVYFPNPRPLQFDTEFKKDHPNDWSAVAWEYPSILQVWSDMAEKAGSIEPTAVRETLLAQTAPPHTFGPGKWWGKELWGLDNCIIGKWPVVVMKNGKARITEFMDVYSWLEEHGDVLKKHMKALGLRVI